MHETHVSRVTAQPLTRQMDLNLLELFDCIWRTRNLTAAGEQLGLSQPAVSRALARLRQTYDDALFIRQQRGVLPTPMAERLAEPVAAALAIVRATITKSSFDPQKDTRHFRVAMSDIGERMFLPRLLDYLAREAPGVTVETCPPQADTLAQQLAAGKVDLGVGYVRGLGKAVEQQCLFQERYVHVARAGHPLLKKCQAPLTEALLRDLTHAIAAPPGTLHGVMIERALSARRVQATIGLRVQSFLCLGPVVAQTDLVATLPNNLAGLVAPHMGLICFDSPLPVRPFDVNMLWHRRFRHDPALVWLRQVFLSLFGQSLSVGEEPAWS